MTSVIPSASLSPAKAPPAPAQSTVRYSDSLLARAVLLGLVATALPVSLCCAADVEAIEIAAELVRRGARTSGSPAHAEAQRFLSDSLRSIGLQDVARTFASDPSVVNIEGRLVGQGSGEIVLAAHYDSVAGSPGAADNAAGCAVLVAALASLSRQPLQHSVRVVFFDAEERGLLGSRGWVEALGAADRDRILAAIHVDTVGMRRSSAPTILSFRARDAQGRSTMTPGWLVHAARESSRAMGWPFRFADPGMSVPMQLALRANRSRYGSDADAFLAAGIPAIVLSDFTLLNPYTEYHGAGDVLERLDAERLARWSSVIAAMVLRLDRLAGRPRWDDEYLVVGRVWLRRDLLWLGFLLWVVLVLRGRPSRWKGASAVERSLSGRLYLPGFCFRAIFLLVALWIPALGAWLVYPLGLLALAKPSSLAGRIAWQVLGLAPLAVFCLFVTLGYGRGVLRSWDVSLLQTAVLGAAIAAYSWMQWSDRDSGMRWRRSLDARNVPS